tara:strand:- start:109 stop:630 length:522 start_codon:yes stop_codon:yes gene_type:complete
MVKKHKAKGKLFWITGLSGSGKTSIAEKIKYEISRNYGPTLTISGDDLRKLFNYKKFSKNARLNYALSYSNFCKYVTDQNLNVIISTVSLFHKVRRWNRSNIQNYLEIYIKADISKIIKKKKKFFYKGNYKNVIGKNMRAEFPKKPDIIIENNFKKPLSALSKELMSKIKMKK